MNTNIFDIIISNYLSPKSNYLLKNKFVLVLKVRKNFNKIEIKNAILKLFNIKVKKINTLTTKIKIKRNKNNIGYTKSWKKVYATLYKNQDLSFLNKLNKN